MAEKDLLPASELGKYLRCDSRTGRLFWNSRGKDLLPGLRQRNSWNSKNADREALCCVGKDGYLYGRINRCFVLAHRAVWALHYGEWPDGQIDHVNGIASDNRIENLRCVSNQQNQRNRWLSKNNTSGASGVYRAGYGNKWRAMIGVNGKKIGLGYYEDFDGALAARKAAEAEYGFSERHGVAKRLYLMGKEAGGK